MTEYSVGRDHNGRTCIRLDDVAGIISYIPMAEGEGFKVEETSPESFKSRYKILVDYPVDRACQLFLSYSILLGASIEVMKALGKVITVTKEEEEMATSKFSNPPPTDMKPKKKAVKKKATAKKKVAKKPVKKSVVKKPTAKKSNAEYKSASQMFQALILEGKMTDDNIFSAVQEAFGLDDKKRSYVSWYRNKLKKDGQNPPEAK